MPQVDKATFFSIVFWTFMIYSLGYLFLNTTTLYSFLTTLKLTTKRSVYTHVMAWGGRRMTSAMLMFPLVAL